MTSSPTRDKPQNKLWYHDGAWWAVMLSPADDSVHIFELLPDQSWRQTDAVIDDRLDSTADVRWDGSKLYVASRHPTLPLRVMRFSYNDQDRSYFLDSGFPVSVNAVGTSSANIERDSAGRLWVAYIKSRQLWVAHSTVDQLTWAPPFVPVLEGTTTSVDDVASLVALDGRIGLMWSNQASDSFYFALHDDRDPPERWSVERPLSGAGLVDNHIDLKSWGERVYAVVKTSLGDSEDPDMDAPLALVLIREPDGTWSQRVFGTVADGHTRPIALIDRDSEMLYIFATRRHDVLYKTAPLSRPEFAPGPGNPFLSYSGVHLIDPTTSDHPVDADSGIVILANSMEDRHYYHAVLPLSGEPAHEPLQAAPSISFRSAASRATAAAGTLTLDLPAGTLAGDLLLASVDASGATTVQPPTGWTFIRSDDYGEMRKSTYYRLADGEEPNAHAWQLAGGEGPAAGLILAYAGVDGASPIDAAAGRASDDSAAITLPAIRVSTPGSRLVALFGAMLPSGVNAPSPMVQVAATGVTSDSRSLTSQAAEASCPSTGPVREMAGQAAAAVGGMAQVVLLRPAAGSAGQPTPSAVPMPVPSAAVPSPSAETPNGAIGITFRSAATGSNTADDLLTVDVPAGTEPGDLLLASIDIRGAAELTAPHGWTLIRTDTSDRAITKTTYYRVADMAEPRWYTWFLARAAPAVASILAYSGVDPEAPVEVSGGQTSDEVTHSLLAPSVRSTAPGARLVALFSIAAPSRLSPPAQLEQRSEVETPPTDHPLASLVADRTLGQAGRTVRFAATGQRAGKGVAQVVVLRPRD